MAGYKSPFFALHGAVLLFALSGLFAKWLALSAITIVFGRTLFAAVALVLFILVSKQQTLSIPRRLVLPLLVTGLVLALHWLSFFYAIQLSSVAVGLITFASFPVFVSFLEPLFFKEPFHYLTLVQALLTLAGISLILPVEQLDSASFDGAYYGILSAFLFALLTMLNRKFVKQTSAKKVALYQNGFACTFLLPLILLDTVEVSASQLSLLILLGVVFTAIAHSLFNHALKTITAHAASIAVSLEPIYGILAAFVLLNEPITLLMTIGGGIVLLTNVWISRN